MKKILPIAFLIISLSGFSQPDGKMRERIKAQKTSFITEKLDLSADEAAKFWPVYNSFEAKENALKKESSERRKKVDLNSISENDAKKLLTEIDGMMLKKHQLQSQLIKDLLKVIPAKKVILLNRAEKEFNRKILERLREYRGKRQKDRD